MTRRILLPAAAALALLWGAGVAVAASPPPPPPPPAVPAPAVAPTPVAPAAPVAPARGAAPVAPAAPTGGLDAWALPSAKRLSALWPELAGADLSRDATRGDLDRAVGILTGVAPASPDPAAPASAWTVNLRMVRALGLEPELRGLARITIASGQRLRMPRNAPSELLAREAGLVYNRPATQDARERSRGEAVRLADVVYALDRARMVGSWQRARLARYRSISLPAMTPQRFAAVQAAFWQVGQPYIWGGDWPGVRSPWGAQGHGGFDCSGLVWWAYKGRTAAAQMSLGTGLLGRTADAMAFERPTERVPVAALAPGDLVFFGAGGPAARKGTIGHTGIAVGNGWMIHSSGSRAGVALSHLDDYWPSATAFGRRITQLGP
ncbi:C40 family peptidase [Miltoncostaea oceani]|uniref:C40 family peptidase n=1 Tax=Miltoncostaea oceani TaxID=2843216 RepID=UPI001C3C64A3|nr:C40 family peptidase [Miltoncostaea oceani]